MLYLFYLPPITHIFGLFLSRLCVLLLLLCSQTKRREMEAAAERLEKANSEQVDIPKPDAGVEDAEIVLSATIAQAQSHVLDAAARKLKHELLLERLREAPLIHDLVFGDQFDQRQHTDHNSSSIQKLVRHQIQHLCTKESELAMLATQTDTILRDLHSTRCESAKLIEQNRRLYSEWKTNARILGVPFVDDDIDSVLNHPDDTKTDRRGDNIRSTLETKVQQLHQEVELVAHVLEGLIIESRVDWSRDAALRETMLQLVDEVSV
jgi:Centromere protein H (CENP-H)